MVLRRHRITVSLLLGTALVGSASAQTSTEPLLQQANLVYQGAFRLPQIACPSTYACFSYGGTAVTYDAADNSLYIVGHPYGQLSAEVSIPALVNSTSLSALNTATLMQPFADATGGQRRAVNPGTPNPIYIGGQFVYNSKLIVTAYSYYDGSGTQNTSHFVSPVNLSAATSQVAGPSRVGSQYPGFVDGYMALVPAEWQAALGGPVLTGNCCMAIAGIQSNGPAVSAFDPEQLGMVIPVPATTLVGYPNSHPLGTGWGTQSTLYNGSTEITGIVFAPGTRSVLFFGRQGTGPFCYGSGTASAALTGQMTGSGTDRYCYDPANSSKGTHAYPYVYQVWAYDANDLLAVKNGSQAQYQIQPYAVWTFHLPFEGVDNHYLGGAGFDAQRNLIYLSQLQEDSTNPIIHVFHVNGSLAVPNPPSAIIAH